MAERRNASTHRLETDRSVDLTLSIDHGQFFVLDRDGEIALDGYDEESQALGLASFEDGVAVFCESHWSRSTPLRLTLAGERPSLNVAVRDHVVVGGIACPSGELRIFSPEETGFGERTVLLAPATYGLIICGDDFGHADEYGDDGTDRYQLWLWPVDPAPAPESLKSGLPGA